MLIFAVVHHLLVSTIRNSKEMRRHLIPPFTNVDVNNSVGVDRIALVWIDNNTEQPRVGLNRTNESKILQDFIIKTYIDKLCHIEPLM